MRRVVYHSRHGVMMMLILTVLFSAVVPLLFTIISQLLFPTASHGSLIIKDGKVIGSELLGQEFKSERYFWGRPSATTPPYNAAASAATNFSVGNSMLLEQANKRMARFPTGEKIPVSLITASSSGLDPHITPQAALFQAKRVAKARGLPVEKIKALIDDVTEAPHLGFIGTARVNVLTLNLALDRLQ